MPAPKKAAAPKKPAATTAAAKPAAKKPAPAKKPAAKKPAASIKAPAVKKPAVAKKAPTAPAVKPAVAKKIPASKKPVGTVLKAPAKPVAKAPAKPRAKVAPADGIKKTAIPAKPAGTSFRQLQEDAGLSKATELKTTVATARPSDLNPAITVLGAEPSDHVVLAHTNPLGSDYTVNFFAGVKGGSAYRQMHLTATQKSKKRLSIEQTINSVLKAALGYENKRSQGKAFRGITALSVVVTRNSTSVTQPLSILLHLNPLQAMAL